MLPPHPQPAGVFGSAARGEELSGQSRMHLQELWPVAATGVSEGIRSSNDSCNNCESPARPLLGQALLLASPKHEGSCPLSGPSSLSPLISSKVPFILSMGFFVVFFYLILARVHFS